MEFTPLLHVCGHSVVCFLIRITRGLGICHSVSERTAEEQRLGVFEERVRGIYAYLSGTR